MSMSDPAAHAPPVAASTATLKPTILMILAGVVVLGGALLVCSGVVWWRMRPAPALPFATKRLPASVTTLKGETLNTSVRQSMAVLELDVPKEFHWVAMASTVCGDEGFLGLVASVRSALHDADLAEKLDLSGKAEAIRCGRGWAKVVGDGYLHNVHVENLGKTSASRMFAGTATAPGTDVAEFKKASAPLSFEDARCYQEYRSCGQFTMTVARRSRTLEKDTKLNVWVMGFPGDVGSFISFRKWEPNRLKRWDARVSDARGADAFLIKEDSAWRAEISSGGLRIEQQRDESSNGGMPKVVSVLVDRAQGPPGNFKMTERTDLGPKAAAYYAAWKEAFAAAEPSGLSKSTWKVQPDKSKTQPYVEEVNARAQQIAAKLRQAVGEK